MVKSEKKQEQICQVEPKDVLKAISQVDEIHTEVKRMSTHSEHLSKLDVIADSLKSMEKNLVGPATGRKQIPLGSHLLIVLILGAMLLVVLIEKSSKSISLTPKGIIISENSTGINENGLH